MIFGLRTFDTSGRDGKKYKKYASYGFSKVKVNQKGRVIAVRRRGSSSWSAPTKKR